MPIRWFPFQRQVAALPTAKPDCHLVRTAILYLPSDDSLGVFHCSHAVSYPLLQIWFQGNITSSLAGDLVHQLPYPPYPRKAGYSAHSVRASKEAGSTALQVYSSVSYTGRLTTMGVRLCTITGLHGSRVGFPMPLGSALQPQARIWHASLQHPPQTGRKKQAPKVSQLCPLKDF